MSEALTNQIGEQLKAARLEKNMSLDDVQNITKIQPRYLEAIENNNLNVLPGEFYVRAFIRQYALAVGLAPEDLLGEVAPTAMTRTSDLMRAHRDDDGVVRAGSQNKVSTKSKLSNMLPFVWLCIVVLVVLAGIWFAMVHLTQGKQESNDNDNVAVSSSSVSKSSSSSESSASSSSQESDSNKKNTLSLGTPEQNTSMQTTIYNVSGQKDKEHEIKITGKNTGSNVKVTVGTNILLNEMVTSDKTITVPSGSESVNVQFTAVSNATMTIDNQKVTVDSSATPFWNVLINLNK